MVRAVAMPAKGSTDSSVLASPPQRQMRNSAQRYMRRRSSQLQKESETAARDVGIRLLQEGRLVVRTAVERNSAALHWAPDTFKNDRERILELVRRDGLVLQHVEPEWQNDHGVVMAAVLQNGWAFRFASSALRADHEVVEAAVEAHGRNLCYVSDQRLRSRAVAPLHCKKRVGPSVGERHAKAGAGLPGPGGRSEWLGPCVCARLSSFCAVSR
jgi:hypothetical protein